MSKQVFIAGNINNNLGSQSTFLTYTGTEIWSSANRNIRVACSGSIINNLVKLNNACGNGNSRSFDIFKNNATEGTLTISDLDLTAEKDNYNISLTIGDTIRYRLSASGGTPPTQAAIWSSIFESTNPNESTHGGGNATTGTSSSSTVVNYCSPVGTFSWTSTDDSFIVIPCSGYIKNLTVGHPTAPGTGKSKEFEILKNGLSTGLKVIIAEAETSGVNITDIITVIAGDKISLRSTPTNTPNASILNISWCFESLKADNVPVFYASGTFSNASEHYYPIAGFGNPLTTNHAYQLSNEIYITDIAVCLKTAPGLNKSRKFILLKNGQETSLTLTLRNSETFKIFDTNIKINDFDELTTKEILTSSPSDSLVAISYVTNINFKKVLHVIPFYKKFFNTYLNSGLWFDFFTTKLFRKIP